MPRLAPSALRARLRRVRLFLCDVDGVLTDASVFLGADLEFKRFDIQDGLGLRLLARCGLKTGWVSNRPSSATTQRAVELKIDYLSQDKGSKVAAVEAILAQASLTWAEVCYVGDDIVDLGVLRRAGGQGAVREVIQLILQAQGHWKKLVAEYSR